MGTERPWFPVAEQWRYGGGLDGVDSVPTAYLTWACHD